MTHWTLTIDGTPARHELPLIKSGDGGARSIAEGRVLSLAAKAARNGSNVQIVTASGKLHAENFGSKIVRCSDGKELR